LADSERPGEGRAHGDLNRNHDAVFVVRLNDPAEAAQRDDAITIGLGVVRAFNRAENFDEHLPYVGVGPGCRICSHELRLFDDRGFPASQHHFDVERHAH